MNNKFNTEVCDVLNENLPVYTRKGPGGNYPYHKGEDIIRQMNKAFSHSWSSRVVDEKVVQDQILVRVEVVAYTEGGQPITHEGFGSSDIAKFKGSDKPVNIGNSYKSAFTSALKKACEQFGVGLNGEEEPASKPVYTSNPSSEPAPPSPPKSSGGGLPKVSNKSLGGPMGASRGVPMGSPGKLPQTSPAPEKPRQTGADPITSAQKNAIENIMKMRQLDPGTLLQSVLPGTNKTSLEDLTKNEAIKVIRNAIQSSTGA